MVESDVRSVGVEYAGTRLAEAQHLVRLGATPQREQPEPREQKQR